MNPVAEDHCWTARIRKELDALNNWKSKWGWLITDGYDKIDEKSKSTDSKSPVLITLGIPEPRSVALPPNIYFWERSPRRKAGKM